MVTDIYTPHIGAPKSHRKTIGAPKHSSQLLRSTPMASDEAPAPAADRIRVVGKWVGALEVDLGAWTVPMLRAEVARRVGDGVDPERVGLIFGGRVLKDDPPASLRESGLKGNAKVLSSLTSPDRAKEIAAEAAKAKAEEEHAARLVRLW